MNRPDTPLGPVEEQELAGLTGDERTRVRQRQRANELVQQRLRERLVTSGDAMLRACRRMDPKGSGRLNEPQFRSILRTAVPNGLTQEDEDMLVRRAPQEGTSPPAFLWKEFTESFGLTVPRGEGMLTMNSLQNGSAAPSAGRQRAPALSLPPRELQRLLRSKIDEKSSSRAQYFAEAHPDADGRVARNRWRNFLDRLNISVTDAQANELFDWMDQNKSGYIERDDWVKALVTGGNGPAARRPSSRHSSRPATATSQRSRPATAASVRSEAKEESKLSPEEEGAKREADLKAMRRGLEGRRPAVSRELERAGLAPDDVIGYSEARLVLRSAGVAHTVRGLHEMLKRADRDANGHVSVKEFCTAAGLSLPQALEVPTKATKTRRGRAVPSATATQRRQPAPLTRIGDIESKIGASVARRWGSLRRLCRRADANGDGHLDREEFMSMLRMCGIEVSPADRDRLVARFDADGDGRVSYAEFLRHMGDALQQPTAAEGASSGASKLPRDRIERGNAVLARIRPRVAKSFRALRAAFVQAAAPRPATAAPRSKKTPEAGSPVQFLRDQRNAEADARRAAGTGERDQTLLVPARPLRNALVQQGIELSEDEFYSLVVALHKRKKAQGGARRDSLLLVDGGFLLQQCLASGQRGKA